MNPFIHKLVAGALSGLLSAILIDLHAWQASPTATFDFKLAAKRWVTGLVSGVTAALGLAEVAA